MSAGNNTSREEKARPPVPNVAAETSTLDIGCQRGVPPLHSAGERRRVVRGMPIPAWQQGTGRPHVKLRRSEEDAEVKNHRTARIREAATTEAGEAAEAVAAPREAPMYDASRNRKR